MDADTRAIGMDAAARPTTGVDAGTGVYAIFEWLRLLRHGHLGFGYHWVL